MSKFKAQVYAHADLTAAALTRAIVNALQDLLEIIQTSAPGVTAGGTLIEGRFPVVSSDLIRSLVTELDGAKTGEGQTAYAVGLANFELGAFIRFSWTMAYALRVELGYTATDSLGRSYQQQGWHMVGKNVPQFPAIFERHLRIEGANI
jgi:hypothetical protein